MHSTSVFIKEIVSNILITAYKNMQENNNLIVNQLLVVGRCGNIQRLQVEKS